MLVSKKLPFYWRAVKNNDENRIAKFLDFSFTYSKKYNYIHQKISNKLKSQLSLMYKLNANIGHSHANNSFNLPYTKELIRFIISNSKKGDKILDIGCGGGLIAHYLQKLNYNVTGIDPSRFAKKQCKKLKIKLINDFFPSDKINEKFDIIFCVDVFEHIENPVKFLLNCKKFLKKNGKILISIPDETKSFKLGDSSMAMHQHINYFEKNTILNVLTHAGIKLKNLNYSSWGGSINLSALVPKVQKINKIFNSQLLYSKYKKKAEKNRRKIIYILDYLNKNNYTFGFYAPKRAFPYIFFKKNNYTYRLFDDNPLVYKKKIDGCEIVFENTVDFLKKPTDIIFIFSLSFGDIIKKRLIKRKIKSTSIFTLKDMLILSKENLIKKIKFSVKKI